MIGVRWKRAPVIALAALGMCLGNVATAQDDMSESKVGTRFNRDKFDSDRGARETMSYFGRCVAAYKSDEIRTFLMNPVHETWESIMDFPNDRTHCASRNTVASFVDFRGAVAEGWYLARFKKEPPAFLLNSEATPPAEEETVALIAAASDDEKAQVIVDEFARCVAVVDVRGVDALLRTRHASKEEAAAVQALAPSFSPCAFEGQKLAFDTAGLRSALAYAMARRAAGVGPA